MKDKGVNELIMAFKKLAGLYHNINLVMVGAFEDSDNPIKIITRTEIETHPNIHYYGKQKDVRPFMCMSDVLFYHHIERGLVWFLWKLVLWIFHA